MCKAAVVSTRDVYGGVNDKLVDLTLEEILPPSDLGTTNVYLSGKANVQSMHNGAVL